MTLITFYSLWTLLLSLFINTESTPLEFTDVRDEAIYQYKGINDLNWMTENLRYKTDNSMTISDSINCEGCGEFYDVTDAFKVCPQGWRLPKEKEVRNLIKWHKKKKQSLTEALTILLCGRVDNGKHGKAGEQNTFWMDAPIEEGHVNHWHTFGETQELHSHNVVAAERQFPVRCVCEIDVLISE